MRQEKRTETITYIVDESYRIQYMSKALAKQFSDFEPERSVMRSFGEERSPVVIARWHIRTGRPICFIMKIRGNG